MNALDELAALCKGDVLVEINGHRSNYESVESYLEYCEADDDDVPPTVRAEMVARDRIVRVQFYPQTPIGFCLVLHYDTEAALAVALDMMRAEMSALSEGRET